MMGWPNNYAEYAYDSNGNVVGLVNGGRTLSVKFNSNRKQFRHKPIGGMDTSASGQTTRHATYVLPTDWVAWKVRAWNNQSITIPNHLIAVAASANATSPYTPTGAWTTALFSGVAAHTIPAAPDAANYNYGYIDSDVMFTSSLARDDSGTGTIVMIRSAIPSGAPASNPRLASTLTTGSPTVATAGMQLYYQNAIDGVTTPALFSSPSSVTYAPPVEFIGFTNSSIKRISFVGSSTFQGQGETTGGSYFGFTGRANNILNELNNGYAYYISVDAQSGMKTNYSIKNAIQTAAMGGVDAICYASYSSNDTDRATQEGQDRMIGQTTYFIDECIKNNITPILSTFQAINGETGANQTGRQSVNARVRALAVATGLKVIDVESWVSDMGSTGAWLIPSYTDDGIHPNTLGHTYIATKAAEILETI